MKPKVKTVKKKKKKNKKTYYVSPKRFLQLLKEYYESDDLVEELAESTSKIAVGLSYSPNFINYSYKDEMIGDAIVKMIAAVKNKKFNLESTSNPFSYFTTIAYHAFINRIKKEKKHHEAVTKYKERVYEDYMSDPTNTHGHVYVKPIDEENTFES